MKTDATRDQVIAQLEKHDIPGLEPLLPTYMAFLELENDTQAPPIPLEFVCSEIPSLLRQTTPLLLRDGAPPLPDQMANVWKQVCVLAAQQMPEQEERIGEYKDWPERDYEEWSSRLREFVFNSEVTTDNQEERDLLTFLLIRSWRPFLKHWAQALAPFLDDSAWKQKRCPACGGQPDFAYLGSESGERHLVCGSCDTAWRYHRLGCPFCGNQDAETYGYHPDDIGIYRLYVCKKCHRYLKTLDLRQVPGERIIQAERIATTAMDLAALQAGYQSA